MDSDAWDRRYEGADLLWSAEPNRMFADEVAALGPGRALDVGTGEGRNAVWLAERGWEVTGVDFSAVGLAKAGRLAAARGVKVEWVLADLLGYDPPAGAFDLVAVLYLHLPADDLGQVLRRAAEAVAPGGTLVVIGHDRSNLEEGRGGPQDPAILYTTDGVVAELGGLEVRRAERVRRPVETEEGTVHAIDTLVRAVRPGSRQALRGPA